MGWTRWWDTRGNARTPGGGSVPRRPQRRGEMQVGTLDTPIEVEAIALVAMHIPFVVTYIESPIRTTPLKTEEHQAFGMQCSHARRGEQDVPFGGS